LKAKVSQSNSDTFEFGWVGTLIISLMQIYCWVRGWKTFESRL